MKAITTVTKLVLLIGLAWLPATIAVANDAAEPMTQKAQQATTPAQALEMLKEGNMRFIDGKAIERDYVAQAKQTAGGQFPFASIVSCLDSRVPPEIIFDRGIGDLFVARVAGNFVNDDILGSLEFASKLAGSKLIVVLGHTECGAVMGACDGAQLGLLTTTLANINPAVRAAEGKFESRNSSDPTFVHAVAKKNVELTKQELLDRSLVLREMIESGQVGLVGAMYDIATGEVTFYD